jgi:uncharacterized membrane protein YbaN (DUF454 family)
VTPDQAKEILLLYRPGTTDAADPEVLAAMDLASKDPDLGKWFAQHQTFQLTMRARFREIPAPERLKTAILARNKIVTIPFFRQKPIWLAAAAIFVVLLSLAAFLVKPRVPDHFSHYRETMVSAAVRMYGMDLVTTDGTQLRQFIASRGAPADYDLTQGLAKLPLKGGGLLRWRGHPVSMVCFDRGAGTTLFLFVMNRSALKDPPPASAATPDVTQVNGLTTASWTDGKDAYLLAGPEEAGFPEKYLLGK